jgi:hypothetical protein
MRQNISGRDIDPIADARKVDARGLIETAAQQYLRAYSAEPELLERACRLDVAGVDLRGRKDRMRGPCSVQCRQIG